MDECILRSITDDTGPADSHRDDRVGELDSEDPPRIYTHPQYQRIVLVTSTHQSELAGENETSGKRLRHCASISIVRIQIDEILVEKAGIVCAWKEGLLACA